MRKQLWGWLLPVLLWALASASVRAGAESGNPSVGTATAPREIVRHNAGDFNGVHLKYSSIFEERVLMDASGAPAATITTYSYVKEGGDPASRPVLFVTDGGPGSASIWEHIGYFAPKRVDRADPVRPPTTPPFRMVHNADFPLDVTDVVVIDTVGTGLSRLLPGGRPQDFFTPEQDAKVIVELIQAWITKRGRWGSPKFVAGESYGTIRFPLVARMLTGSAYKSQNLVGITLNGVILMSCALDNPLTSPNSIGVRGPVNLLPTYAAIALYHKKVDAAGKSLEDFTEDARNFAQGDYLRALYAGDRLPPAERQVIAVRMSKFIGLPVELIEEKQLRIDTRTFSDQLLRDEGLATGFYDGRFTLPRKGHGGDAVADDAAMAQYTPSYIATMNEYLRTEFGIATNEVYKAIPFGETLFKWDWGQGPGQEPPERNFAIEMAMAMRNNPDLKLFVWNGVYDLVTPFSETEYVIAHSGLPRERVRVRNFPAGHTPYNLSEDELGRFAADLRGFIQSALKN